MITAPSNALVMITPDLNLVRPSAYVCPEPMTVERRSYRHSQKQRITLASPSSKCVFALTAIAERSLCDVDWYDVHNLQNVSSTDLPTSELQPDQADSPLNRRPTLSVVAGYGVIVTPVSNGVHVEEDVSPDCTKVNVVPSLTVSPGRGVRITAVSSGVTIDYPAVSNQTKMASRVAETSKIHTVLPLRKAFVDTMRKKGVSPVGKVLSSIRTVTAASTTKSTKDYVQAISGQSTKQKASYFEWKSNIQSTVSEMLLPDQIKRQSNYNPSDASSDVSRMLPHPGTILVKDSRSSPISGHQITIRSSVPHSSDDMFIANLRLSVFSNFDKDKQDIFRSRSLEVLNFRRGRGAVALVAEMPIDGVARGHYKNDIDTRIATGHMYGTTAFASIPISKPKKNSDMERKIIGSVECSQHEFCQTILGNFRPKNSLMYVTEVAVSPEARRCGAGMMLMKGVDEVAALRNVESIYLHVDVTNDAARAMYEKAGYEELDKSHPMYTQFTASLNLHDGALMGRSHYLMCKNRVEQTTWLQQ